MAGYEDQKPSESESRRIGGFGTLAVVVLATLVVLVGLTWVLETVDSGVIETEMVPGPNASEETEGGPELLE